MNLVPKLIIPVIAAGALLAAGSLPASAASTRTAAPSSSAVASHAAARAIPAGSEWEWIYKGLYGAPAECESVGRTFSPYTYQCIKYSIGARPGDYEWELMVLELVHT